MRKFEIEQADKVVKAYAIKQTINAYERVLKEKHGTGCGCAQCVKESVNEVNSWLLFSFPYSDIHTKFSINTKGRPQVEGGLMKPR